MSTQPRETTDVGEALFRVASQIFRGAIEAAQTLVEQRERRIIDGVAEALRTARDGADASAASAWAEEQSAARIAQLEERLEVGRGLLADRDEQILRLEDRAREAAEAHGREVARLEGEASGLRAQITSLQAERDVRDAATISIDGRLVRRLMGDGEPLTLAELEQLQRHLDGALAEVVGAIDATHQRLAPPTAEHRAAAGDVGEDWEVSLEDIEDLDQVEETPKESASERREREAAAEVVARVEGNPRYTRTWLIAIAKEVLHHHGLGEGPRILRAAAAAMGGSFPEAQPVHPEGWATVVARADALRARREEGAA